MHSSEVAIAKHQISNDSTHAHNSMKSTNDNGDYTILNNKCIPIHSSSNGTFTDTTVTN